MARKSAALVLILALAGCSGGPHDRHPEAARKKFKEAEAAAKKGDHVEAIDLYTAALEEDPEFSDAYFQRGWHYIASRDPEKPPLPMRERVDHALSDYTLAIRFNPAHADAYFSRAMIWASRANYKLAVEDLLVAGRYKDRDPEPQLLLGELYEYKFENRTPAAMQHYEKYVELGGTNELVREKVKIWKQLTAAAGQPKKEPTAEDEKKAEELHQQMLKLIGAGKEPEAFKALEEIVTKYGHTKYFKEPTRNKALTAMYAALKEKYAKPK